MVLDLDTFLRLLPFIVSIVSGGLAIWFARNKAITDRVTKNEQEIRALDATIKQMASREDVHSISLQLSDLGGELKVMSAQLQGQTDLLRRMDNTVNRHEEHLLKGAQ